MSKLKRDFYRRNTRVVAIELLGKVLVVRNSKHTMRAKIVETEAYFGDKDPASHAYRGVTPRNRVMFGPPGFSYVYFVYGNHYCFNVVTEEDGTAGAVLIRAVEPLKGIREMMKRRGVKKLHHATNGPGKLTQALGISRRHSGIDLRGNNIFVTNDQSLSKKNLIIGVSPRIGVGGGRDKLYRFYIKDSKFVSKFKI